MSKNITRIVEDQVQTWSRHSQNYRSEEKSAEYLPIITISREAGARGAELASVLAKKLNFKFWHKDLLQAIAVHSNSDERFLQSLDERRRHAIEDAVLGFVQNAGSNVSYLRSLIRIVKTIETHGKSIIVGRGANYICTLESTLDIRVVCPFNIRVKDYAERHGVSRNEANRTLQNMDKERFDFIKYNFHRNVNEPTDYDIVLNSSIYPIEKMADIVIMAYQEKSNKEIKLQSA